MTEKINGNFTGKSIVSIDQFDVDDIADLFTEAEAMRQVVAETGGADILRHKELANLFYEPSTRTSSSFEAAMHRLGGNVIQINNVEFSSVAKGETLADTVRTLEQYADLIVLRHKQIGAAAIAANAAHVPVINAGDGIGEHPTQALLDLFTIKERLGRLQGLAVTMVGDLKHGRTVHSLSKLLAQYGGRLNYVSPDALQMPEEYQRKLAEHGIEQNHYPDIESALTDTDVLYMTRVQQERFESESEYERLKHAFVLDGAVMRHAKDDMIVMHPLPRVGEIAEEVDTDPRAAYFEQMGFGMHIRMALIAKVLGKSVLPQPLSK